MGLEIVPPGYGCCAQPPKNDLTKPPEWWDNEFPDTRYSVIRGFMELEMISISTEETPPLIMDTYTYEPVRWACKVNNRHIGYFSDSKSAMVEGYRFVIRLCFQ